MEPTKLERIVYVQPAYDCVGVQPCVHGSAQCIPGTGSCHGRHNAELHMTVRGPDAEIILVIGTGWDLPSVPMHQRVSRDRDYPRGSFVEIHTARPSVAGQDRRDPDTGTAACKDWEACYINRGYLLADEPAALLAAKGSDMVWAWLENYYESIQFDMLAIANGDQAQS